MPSSTAPRDMTAQESASLLDANARAKTSVPSPTRLGGDLSDFTLADVVQLIIFSRKTGALSITQHEHESLLFFDQGQLVHAQSMGGAGEDAAFSVFDIVTGKFEFHTGITAAERTIFIDGTHFLIEAARRADEAAKNAAEAREEQESGQIPQPPQAEENPHPQQSRPKLSIVRNEDEDGGGLYFDAALHGEKETGGSLADDFLSALSSTSSELFSITPKEAGQDDRIKELLGSMEEIASFSLFNAGGNPVFRSASEKDPARAKDFFFFDGDGASTSLILETARNLSGLLDCGGIKSAVVFLPPSGRKMLFEHKNRLVAAELNPGRSPVELMAFINSALNAG